MQINPHPQEPTFNRNGNSTVMNSDSNKPHFTHLFEM